MAKTPTNAPLMQENPENPAETVATPTESQPLIEAIPPEVYPSPATTQAEPSSSAPIEEASEPVKEAVPAPPPPAAAKVEPNSQPQPQSPFLPLVFGGLLAGVVGFGVAMFTQPAQDSSLAPRIVANESGLATLERRLANLPEPDLSGMEQALNDQSQVIAAMNARITTAEAALADLANRLTRLEELPKTEDGNVDLAIAAYEAELDALRGEISQMASAAQTELSQAREAAAAIEANAAAAAQNAAARAALARIQTALESGSPIGAALNDLKDATGNAAPAALTAVRDGVPTLGALQETFPDVARAALATARSEGVAGEDSNSITAFLRNQFDVRSTAPRDGMDADAILSRAEAAVRGGRLSDALAEIASLPEVARAEMSDWLTLAETRAAAIAAVDTLSASLSDN